MQLRKLSNTPYFNILIKTISAMCKSFRVLGTDLTVEGYARGAYYIFHEDPICNGEEGAHVALNQGHIGKVLMQTKS